MKKILVTGGSGFIGTNLVNFLLKKKNKVTNIDKLSNLSTPERFKNKSDNYSFHKFNISNEKKLKTVLLKNFDTVVHLAAESHVDRSIDTPKKFFLENTKSTIFFYDQIKSLVVNRKIKSPNIIHISTDEVYGSVKKGSSKENSKIYTSSPYSASKASSENIAQFYTETFKLKICILRITNNYGPFQFPEKFVPKTILRIFEKKKIPLYGNGLNIREWMYVEDTCVAINILINKFKNKKIYNIGSNERLNNLSVLHKMFEKLNYKKNMISLVKDRPGHDFRYALNSDLFRKEFNWKSINDFNSGINKTIEWYKTNHSWVNEIKKKYKDYRLGNT